jgi:FdhE protein
MPHVRPDPVLRPARVLSDEARAALREQSDRAPEWRPWLGLLEVALDQADREGWRTADIRFSTTRQVDAPLLEGASIQVDPSTVADAYAALMAAADAAAGPRTDSGADAGPADPLAMLGAGVRQDEAATSHLAGRAGLPAAFVATVSHFCAVPLLLEAARRAERAIPEGWRAGYCPVCGGWPTLAELRGLERRRVLRCGRCAAGWAREVLHCTFCGERDHRRQGALVPEEGGELVRIETCDTCGGYMKALTTLRPTPPWALPLEDLRTLPLELKAVERGFSRPGRPGWSLSVDIVPDKEMP